MGKPRMGWGEWLSELATHPAVLIAVGSAAGGNLRYWLGRWIDEHAQWLGMPWGTFVINVTGSFLLGFFAVWLSRLAPGSRELYLLLGTGFCGGYTTFSTFEWETLELVRRGDWPVALLNVGASVFVGFVAVASGAVLARLIFGER